MEECAVLYIANCFVKFNSSTKAEMPQTLKVNICCLKHKLCFLGRNDLLKSLAQYLNI